MPKYAVDFLAEIQELTSTTNFDDYSDSVDLLTNLHLFNVPVERSSEKNNVVNALMGNAQCCFKRYPGYQAHRHVVVSRGVQCNEAIIKKVIDNDIESTDNKNLFQSHLTERGDMFTDCFYKEETKSPDNESIVPLKVTDTSRNTGIFKRKPETFTPVTLEPPELRASSKFFRKTYPNDYKKNRKYFDDDIDSLSATISNYSIQENLIRLEDQVNSNRGSELIDQNNHKFNNNAGLASLLSHRENNLKGSAEAIKGSMTRSLTTKSQIISFTKKDFLENQSSDSYTSFKNLKDNKSTLILNSGDSTQEINLDEVEMKKQEPQTKSGNLSNEKLSYITQPVNSNLIHAFSQQPSQTGKPKSLSSSLEKNICADSTPCVSDKVNKSSTGSVTFMKGSEEFKKNDEKTESDNLNTLRKKQRFLMKHSRTNNKLILANNADIPLLILKDSCQEVQYDKNDVEPPNHCQPMLEHSSVPTDLPILKSPLKNQFHNDANGDHTRTTSISRNSCHSENACVTPNQNDHKIKRNVSFDRNKQTDKSCTDQLVNNVQSSNQCSRSTVRAKYCTKKVIKHKFYVPESANIERILCDPSDRRIKAICDRHNCDIEIYSKVPKCGFLKNIIILAAPNNENLRKCVRSLDYSMHWCLTAQLS